MVSRHSMSTGDHGIRAYHEHRKLSPTTARGGSQGWSSDIPACECPTRERNFVLCILHAPCWGCSVLPGDAPCSMVGMLYGYMPSLDSFQPQFSAFGMPSAQATRPDIAPQVPAAIKAAQQVCQSLYYFARGPVVAQWHAQLSGMHSSGARRV